VRLVLVYGVQVAIPQLASLMPVPTITGRNSAIFSTLGTGSAETRRQRAYFHLAE